MQNDAPDPSSPPSGSEFRSSGPGSLLKPRFGRFSIFGKIRFSEKSGFDFSAKAESAAKALQEGTMMLPDVVSAITAWNQTIELKDSCGVPYKRKK